MNKSNITTTFTPDCIVDQSRLYCQIEIELLQKSSFSGALLCLLCYFPVRTFPSRDRECFRSYTSLSDFLLLRFLFCFWKTLEHFLKSDQIDHAVKSVDARISPKESLFRCGAKTTDAQAHSQGAMYVGSGSSLIRCFCSTSSVYQIARLIILFIATHYFLIAKVIVPSMSLNYLWFTMPFKDMSLVAR